MTHRRCQAMSKTNSVRIPGTADDSWPDLPNLVPGEKKFSNAHRSAGSLDSKTVSVSIVCLILEFRSTTQLETPDTLDWLEWCSRDRGATAAVPDSCSEWKAEVPGLMFEENRPVDTGVGIGRQNLQKADPFSCTWRKIHKELWQGCPADCIGNTEDFPHIDPFLGGPTILLHRSRFTIMQEQTQNFNPPQVKTGNNFSSYCLELVTKLRTREDAPWTPHPRSGLPEWGIQGQKSQPRPSATTEPELRVAPDLREA